LRRVCVRVEPFLVEKWLNRYEHDVEVNISETCVDPFTLREFLALTERERFFEEFQDMQLTYGFIPGSLPLRQGIADLYDDLRPENILLAGGAIGANFLVFYSLVEPGDTVISVFPTYQQLYSVSRSLGADVKLLRLRMEDGWLPNVDKLESLVDPKTSLIVINNPLNPAGSLIKEEDLEQICSIAEDAGAHLLSDESYLRTYVDPDAHAPSVVDLSKSAVATSSFSKTFSLTGLRLGWIAADRNIIETVEDHRDYTTISNGVIDDALATIAMENVDRILQRNRGIIERNYGILSKWVDEERLIEWVPPRAGTVAFLRYKMDVPSEDLCRQLIDEQGVLLVPGSCFEMEGFLRIGFGGKTDVLREGLSRFTRFLKKYHG
jgi:aspartate/methionine/tyrosine aminotransferase